MMPLSLVQICFTLQGSNISNRVIHLYSLLNAAVDKLLQVCPVRLPFLPFLTIFSQTAHKFFKERLILVLKKYKGEMQFILLTCRLFLLTEIDRNKNNFSSRLMVRKSDIFHSFQNFYVICNSIYTLKKKHIYFLTTFLQPDKLII